MTFGDGDDDERPYIELKKRSPLSIQIAKCMALHDSGVSKKKMHQFRMLSKDVPPLHKITDHQKQLNEEIKKNVRLEATRDKFVCHPEDVLRHVLHLRGIHDDTIDVIMEADGRGTGNSLKTVFVGFRLLNEGRLIHRGDGSHLLGLVRGDESCELMKNQLGDLRAQLKKLQSEGLEIEVNGMKRRLKVRLHMLADGKWLELASGMTSFAAQGNAANCLFCLCKATERANVHEHWPMDENRFKGRLGQGGRTKRDLFEFIPMSRRWGENVHLCLRFLGDKLMAEAYTCIVNDEMGSEDVGMKCVEDQMHSDEIKLKHFKMHGKGESPDESAVQKLSWTQLSCTNLLKAAEAFDVESGFTKNPTKGKLLQSTIDDFMAAHKSLLVWPGDGPPVSKEMMNQVNRKLIAKLIGLKTPVEQKECSDDSDDHSSECEPGEEIADSSDDSAEPGDVGHRETHFAATMVTPHAHMWVNHWGEMHERSRQCCHCFQPEERLDTHGDCCERGGLKFAFTQSLERDNLSFFHSHFQALDRGHETLMERAGMRCLRPLFNPEKVDLSTRFCTWCGRGFRHLARWREHENARCSQRPMRCADDDPHIAAANRAARRSA